MPIYMKIEGIKGDVTAEGHEAWIEVLSFSWGMNQQGAAGRGGGGGAGKVSMQDFHFVHRVDKASPKLMLAACEGRHIPSAEMAVSSERSDLGPVGDGKNPGGDYLVIKLKDLIVSSVRPGADTATDEAALEAVSLNFNDITAEYRTADGSVKGSCN
jgi:type VI secretion system secreted protein Hcp